jgi:hypothetical protein
MRSDMKFEEGSDFWLLVPECGRIQMIQVDFRLSLLVSDGPDARAWLHIETPGELRAMGNAILLVPEQPATLAPILSLFNSEVNSIRISKAGHLQVQFGHNHLLEVAPHQKYEAWQLEYSSRDGDLMFVCSPGGEVVLFRQDKSKGAPANPGLH